MNGARRAARARSGRETPEASGLATIGDMAREFGVSLRALRFYEDRGLLRPQRQGTARFYDATARAHLRLILQGKQLGFTLSEIQELLAGPAQRGDSTLELRLPPEQIEAQLFHLERQRADLEAAIGALRAAHRRLAAVAD